MLLILQKYLKLKDIKIYIKNFNVYKIMQAATSCYVIFLKLFLLGHSHSLAIRLTAPNTERIAENVGSLATAESPPEVFITRL